MAGSSPFDHRSTSDFKTVPTHGRSWYPAGLQLRITSIGRPIRVVLFGGAYFEPAALEFIVRLEDHPDIEFVGGFCEGRGSGIIHRVANLWRRRSLLAIPILGLEVLRYLGSVAANPRAGQPIIVEFRGLPGNAQDWITLVPRDAPANTYHEWFYLKSQRSGSLTFKPVAPGDYEVRAYHNWPAGGYVIHERAPLRVSE